MPLTLEGLSSEHLEEWLIAMREAGRKPTTMAARYRSVSAVLRVAGRRGLNARSSMASIGPPKIPESPPQVLRDEQLVALLKGVEADKAFAGRRDTAILRVFIANGG